jgi:hypothetical protein
MLQPTSSLLKHSDAALTNICFAATMFCMKPGLFKTNFIFEASFSKMMEDHNGVRIKSCCEEVLNMASNLWSLRWCVAF